MGKRQRRRRRETERRPAAQPWRVDLPSQNPILRLVVNADTPEDIRELCLHYWSLTDDGAWSRPVADLGAVRKTTATVAASCHVLLLGVVCLRCNQPARATRRSQASRMTGPNLGRVNRTYRCAPCKEALAVEREELKARARVEAAAAEEQRRMDERAWEERLRAFREKEDAKAPPLGPWLSHRAVGGAAAVYLAMLQFVQASPARSVPSLVDLGATGWTGDLEADVEAVYDLYKGGLIAIHPATPDTVIAGDDPNRVEIYPAQANWRLVGGTDHAEVTAARMEAVLKSAHGPQAADARASLERLVEAMEVADIVECLDGYLTHQYRYPPVPLARRHELAQIIRSGFAQGFTPGQLQCFIWRATDTAAAWKERMGVGPAEASSAAVPILDKKITSAIQRESPVPEYEVRHWHQQAPALAPGRALWRTVQRVRDLEVIAQCLECDAQGFVEVEDAKPMVRRCLHPKDEADVEVTAHEAAGCST
ncbi:hypothetical protein ACFVZD_36940 [Streptomyces sp. NPDC058287]|uniref:hypothetical protein n=1 Tax=Streptomyces sp. NPDC058287 TaxID=3346423 RepID=UPI0036E42998